MQRMGGAYVREDEREATHDGRRSGRSGRCLHEIRRFHDFALRTDVGSSDICCTMAVRRRQRQGGGGGGVMPMIDERRFGVSEARVRKSERARRV